jgi:hypothetical protein
MILLGACSPSLFKFMTMPPKSPGQLALALVVPLSRVGGDSAR